MADPKGAGLDEAAKIEAVRKVIRKVVASAGGAIDPAQLPHLIRAQVEADVLRDLGGDDALRRLIREASKK